MNGDPPLSWTERHVSSNGNRVTAGTGVDIDQRTEWGIKVEQYERVISYGGREQFARHAADADPAHTLMSRTVTTCTSPWLPVSPGGQKPETKD